MKFAYLWHHGPGGDTFEKNCPFSLRHTMSNVGILWCTDRLMAFWCCTHSQLTYWIYQYTITVRNPPPTSYFNTPLRPLLKFDTGAKSELLPVVNVAKCPTHMTWHSHLRLPFTRIYLRFQNLSAWTYLLSAWRTASFRLTSHVLVTTWHLFFYWFTQIQKHLFSLQTSSILNANWWLE